MKKTLASTLLLIGLCAVSAFTGCTSTTQTSVTPPATNADGTVTASATNIVVVQALDMNEVTNIISGLLPVGINALVAKEPQATVYLNDFATVVETFAGGGKFDPVDLTAAIASAKVNELNTPEANALIQAVVSFYRLEYGSRIAPQINKSQAATDAVSVLQAIAGAIRTAIPKPTASLSPDMQRIVERDSEIYLGVYLGMIAERNRKDGGVMMFSATSGELLRWISYQEFWDVYVNKTKPEYASK